MTDRSSDALRPAAPVRFLDFAVRAWREDAFVQVIAHATPAGAMRRPVSVRIGPFSPDDYRLPVDAPLADGATLGRRLARMLLPDAVWRLLGESLRTIAPHPGLGLRLRLCLDDDLIDLPWEFLYRPDVDAPAAHSGFLLMDGRLSLVREPATFVAAPARSDAVQRGLFVGTHFSDGSDTWGVEVEYDSLTRAMHPVQDLLAFEYVRTDATDAVERALGAGCDLFHYAGHVEIASGQGRLIQLARAGDVSEAHEEPARWTRSDRLAPLLVRAGTRLAVFNACNSGAWPFVRPLLQAGVQAVVGVQGLVSNVAALNFAEKLYASLAVGLSLDEALTYARLYVFGIEHSYWDCDWGRFMAYLPTDASVLFPRTDHEPIERLQREVRTARQQTLRDAQIQAEDLDGAGVSAVLSEIAERSVLILGRFTGERKRVLDALKRALSTPPHPYIPILFDFDKPTHRDLIEAIVGYAGVSRFVIADLSDPKSLPAELQAIVPQFPSLPVVPIIEASQREYAVSDHILRRSSVSSPVVRYLDAEHLLGILDDEILAPAEALYRRLKPGVPVA